MKWFSLGSALNAIVLVAFAGCLVQNPPEAQPDNPSMWTRTIEQEVTSGAAGLTVAIQGAGECTLTRSTTDEAGAERMTSLHQFIVNGTVLSAGYLYGRGLAYGEIRGVEWMPPTSGGTVGIKQTGEKILNTTTPIRLTILQQVDTTAGSAVIEITCEHAPAEFSVMRARNVVLFDAAKPESNTTLRLCANAGCSVGLDLVSGGRLDFVVESDMEVFVWALPGAVEGRFLLEGPDGVEWDLAPGGHKSLWRGPPGSYTATLDFVSVGAASRAPVVIGYLVDWHEDQPDRLDE